MNIPDLARNFRRNYLDPAHILDEQHLVHYGIVCQGKATEASVKFGVLLRMHQQRMQFVLDDRCTLFFGMGVDIPDIIVLFPYGGTF